MHQSLSALTVYIGNSRQLLEMMQIDSLDGSASLVVA